MSEHNEQDFTLGKLEGKIDLMISKQDKLENWFVEHAKSDNIKFDEIHSSISGMKSKMLVVGTIFIAAIEGGKTAVISWFGGK